MVDDVEASPCPNRDDLCAYALGELSEGLLGLVAAHVAGCESCRKLLDELDDQSDSFVTHLRDQALGRGSSDETELGKLVRRAERLRCRHADED